MSEVTPTPAAYVTRKRGIYVVTILTDTSYPFHSAQAAQDFCERYLPGATVQWVLPHEGRSLSNA